MLSPRVKHHLRVGRRRALQLIFALLCASATIDSSLGSAASSPIEPAATPSVTIEQLDVAQGDAVLITTPDGRHALIDGGPEGGAVAAMLSTRGIDTLSLVIASHNHADHIGGLPAVFLVSSVRVFIENGLPHTTAVYRKLVERVELEPGLRVLAPISRKITMGAVTFYILPPPSLDATQNNNSVGVIVEYGSFRALFTGDAERPELGRWLSDGLVPAVTVVKVAHHGSRNGTTAGWIRKTRPSIALLSVGKKNGYQHPSEDVLRSWSAAGARVFRTDREGTITISGKADGRFTVRTDSGHTLNGETRLHD